MNFAKHSNPVDPPIFLDILNGESITHLDVSNFFVDSNIFSLCLNQIIITLSTLFVFCSFLFE
jgi:hypothetical protein